MRPASATRDTPEKPKQESADDRDARLESGYSYDRLGERTTMAFVSVYRDSLVDAFYEWREREYQLHRTTGEGVFDGLRRWEVSRFGAQLDNGPHGMLLFWVRCKLTPEHGGRVISPGYFDRGPVQSKRLPATPEVMVDKLSREMTMPHAPGKKAHEKRVAELEQQRDGLRLDVDRGGPA